jgi:hypothetical protein
MKNVLQIETGLFLGSVLFSKPMDLRESGDTWANPQPLALPL